MTSFVSLEGKENPKGTLAARLGTKRSYLFTACPGSGSHLAGEFPSITAAGRDVKARISRDRKPVVRSRTRASVALTAKNILRGTVRTGLLLSGVHHASSFLSIRYQSFSVRVCSPKPFLMCWLTSSDVSVSVLRARWMADAVSSGTVAVVEELVTSTPANRASPTSATTKESPVVGMAALESVSISLGKVVTGGGATWFG